MSVPRATAMDPQCEIFLPGMADEIRDGVAADHLAADGNAYFLSLYLGCLDTTVVSGWCYISPVVTGDATGLFVSFHASKESNTKRNGYVISEQGKPPDFVLGSRFLRQRKPGRYGEARCLRRPGHPRILAVRPHRRVQRRVPGRRPAGGRPLSAHCH